VREKVGKKSRGWLVGQPGYVAVARTKDGEIRRGFLCPQFTVNNAQRYAGTSEHNLRRCGFLTNLNVTDFNQGIDCFIEALGFPASRLDKGIEAFHEAEYGSRVDVQGFDIED